MIVGVPKEIKNHEYRVAMVPAGVRSLVGRRSHGHRPASAGEGSGISDAEYVAAGAADQAGRRRTSSPRRR